MAENNEYKQVPITDLRPYENNPRLNSEAVDPLVESIRELGFRAPIVVDKDMNILAGHTRLKAAEKLGLTTVPVLIAHDMSEKQARMYRIEDNKVAEKSGWDFDALDIELDALKDDFDLISMGFDTDLMGTEDDTDEDDMPEETVVEEEIPEPPKAAVTKRGDVYVLGDHRLMCGDSTDADDMAKLMGAEEAAITFTSPPYNMQALNTGRARDGPKYLTDDTRTDGQYFDFLDKNMELLLAHSREVFYNIGIISGSKKAAMALVNKYIDNFKDIVYWKKSNPVPAIAKNVISSAVEPIFVFGRNGTRSFQHDPGIYYGVIEGSVASGNPYSKVHHATFPLYLPTEILDKFTDEGDTVLDCFGGTGTTMIACEAQGRRCFMMELDPVYCDIIVERWEKQTGEKAVLMSRTS